MKTIVLVRHAKTQADSETGKDFDRLLTDRGNKEAVIMAQRLLEKVQLDVLVTSTAKRAMETAIHFQKAYKSSSIVLVEKPELYNAFPDAFYEVIKLLNNDYKKAALFAHNPGITDTANYFDVAHVEDMPTCGVFAITADTTDWQEFATAEKRFLFFDFPKMEDAEKK